MASGPDDYVPVRSFRTKTAPHRPEIILLVEDDDSIRELMGTVLEADGFTVLRARHSKDALLMSAEYPGMIHLLLTDFSMKPYLNGFELAQLVRQCRPEVRVIYASGYVEYNVLRDEIESAASAFLAKPFSPNGLLDCVRQALGIPA